MEQIGEDAPSGAYLAPFTLPQMKRPSIAGQPNTWPFGQDAHQPDNGYGPAASPVKCGGRLFRAASTPAEETGLCRPAPAKPGQ